MLFLLNNRVFNLAGGIKLATDAGMPMSMVTQFTAPDVIAAAQAAFLDKPDLPVADPVKANGLAYLIASRTQANAALFVVPPKAKVAAKVAYRLAKVDILSLGSLHGLQAQGRISDDLVNSSVWRAVA